MYETCAFACSAFNLRPRAHALHPHVGITPIAFKNSAALSSVNFFFELAQIRLIDDLWPYAARERHPVESLLLLSWALLDLGKQFRRFISPNVV
jgi:hypothetical protein